MSNKYGHRTHNWFESVVNCIGGEDRAEAFKRGEFKLVPRDPADLLRPSGEPLDLPAVPRFVAKDAFTKANGIAWMGENFKRVMLPLVEENITATTLTVSELIDSAVAFRIAAELNVDRRGKVALAHFFHVLRVKPINLTWVAAFIDGNDGECWTVNAGLGSDGWYVNAYSLGDRYGWRAGGRFLSR